MRTFASLLIVSLFTMLFLSSCTGVKAKAAFGKEGNRHVSAINALLDIDFSDLLDDGEYVTFGTSDLVIDWREQRILEKQQAEVVENLGSIEGLSQGELRRMGICIAEGGLRYSLADLHMLLVMHKARYGELPKTAIHLFPALHELDEEEVAAMDRSELFKQYAIAINPVTGKFYDSFTCDPWTAGGYSVQIIDDPTEIAERWPRRRVNSNPADPDSELIPPTSVWLIKLYCESGDRLLFETEECVF